MKLQPKLAPKLALIFVAFALLVVLGLGTPIYYYGRSLLLDSRVSDLVSAAIEKQAALAYWVEERERDLEALAVSAHLAEHFGNLDVSALHAGVFATAPKTPETDMDHLRSLLGRWIGEHGHFQSLMIIEPEHGQVVFSTDPRESGTFKENRSYFLNGRERLSTSDLQFSVSLQAPTMVVSAPIRDATGKALGVLAGRLNLGELDDILSRRTGLHETDDAYLVNAAHLFVTQPRLLTKPAVFQRGVYTAAAAHCLAGQNAAGLGRDYRNLPVVVVHRWLAAQRLCLVVQINQAEALGGVNALGLTIPILGLLILLVAGSIAILIARRIAQPVRALEAGASAVREGNLDVRLPEDSVDEIGRLAREFNAMTGALQRRTSALEESQAALAKAQALVHVGNWRWSIQRNELVSCSEEFARIHGVEPEEIHDFMKQQADRSVHPEDRKRLVETLKTSGKQGRDYETECRIVRPDGEVRHVRVIGQAVFDESGRPVEHVGTLQDVTEEKRAEAALRKSEASLAQAQRIARLGNWELEVETDQLFWSAETYRIFGLEPQELETPVEGFLDMVHPDDLTRVRDTWNRALRDRHPYDIVHRIVRADGAVRHVHQQSETTYDDHGRPKKVTGTLQDITEGKLAEQTIRNSEERFRDFTETASDWFWEMDENLRFTYLSDRFEEVTGVPVDQVIGLTREELYDRHMAAHERVDHEKWQAHYETIEARQAYRNTEVTWCYPDGTERTFASSGKPVFDEAGVFQGYRGTGVEITDRKKAEAALRDSEERFRGLFEQGAVGMAHASPDGRVLQVNQAHSNFTGYAISELIGKRFDTVVHPDDLKEAAGHRRSVLDGRAVNPMHERRYRHKSGEIRWGLAGVAPFRDQDGVLKGYIVQVQDITDRKRAEEEIRTLNAELEQRVEARTAALRAAQEELVRKERLAALGQLTGTVGHELRNPLGAMRTSLAAIRKLAREDEEMLTRSVDIVERSILRCDKIVGELLDYSRVRDLVVEATALDDWIAELLDEYQVLPGVTLRRDLQSGLAPTFDRDRLRRVVVNLLDNACQSVTGDDEGKSPAREPLVTVATRQTDGRVEISVADNGPGIPADQADRIFEPLFSTKAFGFGLGLSIVKQVVEQHGGGIEVDSMDGSGTRMVVWLPLLVPLQRAAS